MSVDLLSPIPPAREAIADRRVWRSLAAIALTALVATPASGISDPAVRCQAAKLVAAGQEANDHLRCHAAAAKIGSAIDAACTAKAVQRLTQRFTRLESRGSCASTNDAGR